MVTIASLDSERIPVVESATIPVSTAIAGMRERQGLILRDWSLAKIRLGRGGHPRPIGEVFARARKEVRSEAT